MKRLLPVSIIICVALASCGSGGSSAVNEKEKQTTLTDLQQDRLSGKVLSVRQRVYWALEKFGRMEKGKLQNLPVQDYLKVYDDDGYLMEEIHYDATDKVVSRKVITYGQKHLMAQEENYKENTLSERIMYTYDEKNRLMKKEKFDGAGKTKEWIQYLYGSNGLVEDEDWYKADGALNCKFIHEYDNDLQLKEKRKYWGGGSLAQREYFYYDNGNLSETVSEKHKDKLPTFDYRYVFAAYDSYGDYGERTQYNEDGDVLQTTKQTFNNLGHLTEYYTITVKQVPMKIEIAAMEESEEEVEDLDTGDEIMTAIEEYAGQAYEYAYDEQNNWVQRITYKLSGNDIDELKRERQFYYERIIGYK
ncbi:MAG: hypothetical protein FWH23_05590 [Bacteroidales bacterium]|nr:hypothetical protein [Bacteroidales bacterium]MCL2133079.1 hypothetical protein [Bacteroidales bacterium]